MRASSQEHRRRWVAVTAAVGAVSLVAACGGGGIGSETGVEQQVGNAAALPNHVPVEYATPDFPSVNGSTAGFENVPEELVQVFDSPPGSGGKYTVMTPLWGTIPPTEGNQYFDAVNEAIGTDLRFQISDGNTYGDKLAAVLASPKDVADWVSIPSWNIPPRFGQAVDTIFTDLTPYLAGDAVEAYPNLANIPTDAWRACMWNGKLYGLPFPGELINDATFYRADLLPEDVELPTTADEMLEFVDSLTDAGDRQWGTNDLWAHATQMFSVPPKWTQDAEGNLVHRVETQEYRDALAWMAELYAQGSVHPDAVAESGDGKERFESGQVLVTADGLGAWHEALGRNLPSNPDFAQQPMPVFAADGGEPQLYKANAASMCSYLKKSDDEAVVAELLEAANFLASPYGTAEYQLINSGVEGVHFELDADRLPVATQLAQTEVQPSYIFLVDPPVVNAKVQYPGYVEDFTTWMADAAPYVVEPLFYGMQITEPAAYASLGQPFEDLEGDIARGRKSLDDLDAAVETWRSSGGEELRAFYQEILDGSAPDAGTD
ncbi:extracellular solute-binding protein [Oerskovia flava]|uniref:extracellular solute-binding protein n=1 Tax=Oerskovia flava TaxID=2986422 RepID=UPI00224003FF|nr:extracellular solute-binding protein [Oerskovia sp. JB1-3-2]